MAEKTTYGKLGRKDLYVIAGDLEGGEEVKQKFLTFSRIFNIDPELCPGVITTLDDVEVIKVYQRSFSEVAVGHLCAPVPPKGTPVMVSASTLYKKIAAGEVMRLADEGENPRLTKSLAAPEEVIDFGNIYKVITKSELELGAEYGDEI